MAVPTYFNTRETIKKIGSLAGLEILRVIDDSTAAGMAYKVDQNHKEPNILTLIINLKGCDATLQSIDRGVFEILTMRSGEVGSEDLDEVLENFLVKAPERDVEKGEKIQDFCKPLDKILDLISEVTAEARLSKTQVDGIIFAWKPSDAVTLRAFIDLYIENTVKIYEGIPSDHVTLTVAAMQADFLSPNYEPDFMPYVEVTRLSLGIDNAGIFVPLILRNYIITTRKLITLITATDHQSSIMVEILEGERLLLSKNRLLGILEITDIEPILAGVPVFDAVFEVDPDGTLSAFKREIGMEKEAKAVLGDKLFDIKQEDVDLVIREGVENQEADRKAKVQLESERGQGEGHFIITPEEVGYWLDVDEISWLDGFSS